jgi:GTP-binding protein EngB required for normal cell division
VLRDHQTLRQSVAEVILRVARIADEDAGPATQEQPPIARGQHLRQIASKLANDVFVLAVVGEFSRGKSTLINALLERPDLLPTSIEPTTAAVTVLSYAPEFRVSARFKDGSTREGLTADDLARLATGHDLDGRARRAELAHRVTSDSDSWAGYHSETDLDINLGDKAAPSSELAALHVALPAPFLEDGIRLVDTPGIGSVNPDHAEATRQFIDHADAVLFLVNTDPAIGQSECNFLSFLRDYVNRFLFVVTKSDRFSPRERQQSVAYTAKTIEQSVGLARPPVFAVSAKLALLGRAEPDEFKYSASGFPEFLNGLHRFLIEARGQQFLRKQAELALSEVNQLVNVSLVELQGLLLGRGSLSGTIDTARSALRQGDERAAEILGRLDAHRVRIDRALEAFSPMAQLRLELLLAAEIERLVDGYDAQQLQRVSESIPAFIHKVLIGRLGPEFARAAEQVVAMRDDILADCRRYLGAVSAGLRLQFEGLRLPQSVPVSLDFDAKEMTRRLERMSALTLGSTLALTLAGLAAVGPLAGLVILGGFVARHTLTSAVRGEVKRRLKVSVAPAIHRLLTELFQNVRDEMTKTAAQFRQEVERFLGAATADVDQTLGRLEQDRSDEDREARQDHLRARLIELEDLRRELEGLIEQQA